VTSVNECHVSPVGPILPIWTNGAQPCGNRCNLIYWGVLLLCCHVALGAEVALPWLATWHAGGAHISGQYSSGAHMAEVDQRGAATWHPLSPFNPACVACLKPPICTQSVDIPMLYPERPWSNLNPLICLFNLFYFLWFYSDSSTCPKIMKFSP
jgi:hypothetical protein